MVRRSREEFDEDFLDAVAAVSDERTPQQIQDAKIDRRQKRRVKDYYPIYSDNPAQWQADLMFLPYTNAKNKTRLHAILCIININNKYALHECFLSLPRGRERQGLRPFGTFG